ncbi:MAG: hypothetical protein JW830_04640 [Bacteroidales bacterium]|nr:hypothetical protein [Bacteroidales bacterium]
MKRILTSCMVCSIFFGGILAQDCPMYYPDMENAQLEYKQYDKKGGLTGSSIQKITSIKKSAGSTEVTVAAESFDAKGKSLGSIELKARCEGGVYYIDMKNFMSQESMEAYKDMEMKMEGGALEIPASMKAGDVLKNGDMKMSFSSGGMTIMNITMNISNRKVDAVESITTPAGTFECYKISYDVAMKMMMNMKSKGVEWYAKGVGMVKSETYSSDGKLLGSNVLTALKK